VFHVYYTGPEPILFVARVSGALHHSTLQYLLFPKGLSGRGQRLLNVQQTNGYEHHFLISSSSLRAVPESCLLLFRHMATPAEIVVPVEAVIDRRKQVLCWCFTLNNYTEDELSQFEVIGNSGDIKYLVVGKEVGEQGTPHLQGFVQLNKKKTFGGITALLPRRCGNVRPMYARSSPYQAAAYCLKDGQYVEYGVPPQPPGVPGRQKQKVDYESAIELAREDRIDEIDPGLRVRYYSTFHKIRDSAPKHLVNAGGCTGLWIVGEHGTGKSHFVRERFGESLCDKPLNKWWCTYRGQRFVLLDDVDTQHSSWIGSYLKRWADKYPFPAEVKGSSIPAIRPELIIVTSNYTIQELFYNVDRKLCAAIEDRFKVVTFTERYEESRAHVLDGVQLQ